MVYGIFLVLVGLTATALVAVTTVHLSSATVNAVLSRDRALVELFVNGNLRSGDLDPDVEASRVVEVESQLRALVAEDEILHVEIRAQNGTVLYSNEPGRRGERPEPSAAMLAALGGDPKAAVIAPDAAADLSGTELETTSVVQEYLPILGRDGTPTAVMAIWRDAAPLAATLDAARRDIVVVTVVAALLLAAVLFGLFRAAHARLARQQERLLEAERRDGLTGMLNHGSVVEFLAKTIESAADSPERIGVALVDVDNFRLINDTHGHEAGDEVLLRVANLVEMESGTGASVARYGPDEFLIVRLGLGVVEMQQTVERLRAGLTEVTLQFGDSERLPVTVSAGVGAYPEHGDAVTELLAAVTVALGEAKASGGDGVREAGVGEEQRQHAGRFDVLHGLVIAVDTKDRYTKRHSEDVARYAVFLALQLGLDEEMLRTLHLSGLLHDVGKIGIPDVILRKPGKLTAEEYDIFKQHVALGDLIVRDVPNLESVRHGIRHHHERWDGHGYLAGLEGEEIPLVGRIMAVADAYSAMTTSRPYRKALPIEEALKRLGDAAGSQLQEELVAAFIRGIETAPDAPVPGADVGPIWRRESLVA
jgi:diguanylate cyclase (GGDEF)-like protein